MILTTCAACAKPLEHDAPARCVGCQTRYCSDRCLRYHAHRGGHDDDCEEIASGGGAEQYHADKKYKEAVAVAVEACADDTKGQTCYICTQAVHWKTKEGLVRMCACRGTAGLAHVSCLAEQAKILFAEAEENNLDIKVRSARWVRWHTCSLCEQQYHGVVECALGWACWKTYVGRPEINVCRNDAMNLLGNGLYDAEHYEDSLSVREANLAMLQRLGVTESFMLTAQANLATTYHKLGRLDQALNMRRDVYTRTLRLYGEEHRESFNTTFNYATMLAQLQRFEEAKALFRKTMPVARRFLGEGHQITLRMRAIYAEALC